MLAGALLLPALPASADASELTCSRPGLYGRQPIVARPETAKRIFLLIEADIFPQADRDAFPEVVVEDEGDRWAVFRHRPHTANADGSVSITVGGGQLSLTIAKCDATISEIHLSR